MFNNKFILFIAFLLASLSADAQNCAIHVKGKVLDEASGLPLSYVNVFVQETANGTFTDDEGNFALEHLCVGAYHFIFSHIGCAPKKFHIEIAKDTTLTIFLAHSAASLDDVVVNGRKNNTNNQAKLSVNRQSIEDNSNQNLSGLLENQVGIHLLKNGSGISKPVVHGLYGNRLTILNNGIIQSGQQWGNDHSPEIDPFSADQITVLKGTNAIEYSGGNMGSAILIEPKKIAREPHLHGQVGYIYETNGRGHSLNARLAKYSPLLAFRISGSLKKYGDKKTADYLLNNTGIEEANLSIQLEKSWNERCFLEFYTSTFNTRLGVLRGSHIGNLTDLEFALTRDVPYYTEPNFSYTIDAPKQQVSHHLAKLKAKYYIDDDQVLELVLGGQLNLRKEFDIRRGDKSDIPALSLNQKTINAELKYNQDFNNNWKFKIGTQNIINDNTNMPGTGILPLIPDYLSWKHALFSILSKQAAKFHFNMGIRYDYEYQSVASISTNVPREIIRYNNHFHNIGATLGLKYKISQTQNIIFNTGYASRNPAINELYSNGLHQGVSGIEEGDVHLKTEKALKNTLEYKWLPSPKFSLNVLAYHQYFKGYIFLNPQDKIRLTIRGAFPVFKYEQTDANIYGLDVSAQFTVRKSFYGLLRYSYIRGNDTKNNIPLVNIPPSSLFGSLTYRANKALKLSPKLQLEALELELNNRYVLQQKHLLPEQDFVLPPPAYYLLGLKVSTNLIFPAYKFRCFLKVDNLFNTSYRDYLNRQRYFADATGISIVIGVNFKF